MRRQQNQKDRALESYEEVLQVRDWRGPLWPQALYAIGETYLESGELNLAYPYFQRIFLLYRNYPELAARAYLQCAEISLQLGLKGDALRTLAEMLQQSDFENMPELAVARQRFEEIQ
jgi:tetratricopeptide (TPR) repeat protein